jgi:hypothetical protein
MLSNARARKTYLFSFFFSFGASPHLPEKTSRARCGAVKLSPLQAGATSAGDLDKCVAVHLITSLF